MSHGRTVLPKELAPIQNANPKLLTFDGYI
jgi:hypothetical protein